MPKTQNQIAPKTGRLRQARIAIQRYWFVAVPAIVLNIAMTLDHVVAKSNEKAITVTLNRDFKTGLENETRHQQDDVPLDRSLRAHWVTANDDGNIEGRISAIEPNQGEAVPIEKLTVTLLQQGNAIHKASTNDVGEFKFTQVLPGVYTLVAAGRNGFLAYGIHVLPKLEEFNILEGGNTQLDSRSKRAFYVSHYGLPEGAVVQDKLQIDAAAIPPEFNTLQRISQNYLTSSSAFAIGRDLDDNKAIDKANLVKGGFKYPLSQEGSFVGRVQPIATANGKKAKLSEMNIFLIQDDIEMSRVSVEENGDFEIEDVEPGVYSVVAAGEDGFAALALELVKPKADLQGATESKRAYYVSNNNQANDTPLGIAIVTDPRDIQAIQNEITRVRILRQPAGRANQQVIYEQVGHYQPPGIDGQIVYQQPLGTVLPPGSFVGSFPVSPGIAPTFQSVPSFAGPSFAQPRFAPVLSRRNGGRLILGSILIALGVDGLSDDAPIAFDPSPASPTTPEIFE